jgi:enoyl-CoA hydratase/carnithine racemase
MAFATTAYEVADAIATITLDRPEQLNALDPTMERELLRVWVILSPPS